MEKEAIIEKYIVKEYIFDVKEQILENNNLKNFCSCNNNISKKTFKKSVKKIGKLINWYKLKISFKNPSKLNEKKYVINQILKELECHHTDHIKQISKNEREYKDWNIVETHSLHTNPNSSIEAIKFIFLNELKKTRNKQKNFSIAFLGNWGSGKTNDILNYLFNNHKDNFYRINLWKLYNENNESNFQERVISEIIGVISEWNEAKLVSTIREFYEEQESKKEILNKLESKLVNFINTSHSIKLDEKNISSDKTLLTSSTNIEEKYYKLYSLLKTKIEQRGYLILFFDDLDRCEGNLLWKGLELIKNYFEIKHLYLIITISEKFLIKAFETKKRVENIKFLNEQTMITKEGKDERKIEDFLKKGFSSDEYNHWLNKHFNYILSNEAFWEGNIYKIKNNYKKYFATNEEKYKNLFFELINLTMKKTSYREINKLLNDFIIFKNSLYLNNVSTQRSVFLNSYLFFIFYKKYNAINWLKIIEYNYEDFKEEFNKDFNEIFQIFIKSNQKNSVDEILFRIWILSKGYKINKKEDIHIFYLSYEFKILNEEINKIIKENDKNLKPQQQNYINFFKILKNHFEKIKKNHKRIIENIKKELLGEESEKILEKSDLNSFEHYFFICIGLEINIFSKYGLKIFKKISFLDESLKESFFKSPPNYDQDWKIKEIKGLCFKIKILNDLFEVINNNLEEFLNFSVKHKKEINISKILFYLDDVGFLIAKIIKHSQDIQTKDLNKIIKSLQIENINKINEIKKYLDNWYNYYLNKYDAWSKNMRLDFIINFFQLKEISKIEEHFQSFKISRKSDFDSFLKIKNELNWDFCKKINLETTSEIKKWISKKIIWPVDGDIKKMNIFLKILKLTIHHNEFLNKIVSVIKSDIFINFLIDNEDKNLIMKFKKHLKNIFIYYSYKNLNIEWEKYDLSDVFNLEIKNNGQLYNIKKQPNESKKYASEVWVFLKKTIIANNFNEKKITMKINSLKNDFLKKQIILFLKNKKIINALNKESKKQNN